MDRKRGARSQSPQHKRQKLAHDTAPHSPPAADADCAKKTGTELCAENLAPGLLTEESVEKMRKEYANSEPYKYARVETLFQDDLLKRVKDECLNHLSFTEKETDIYRVSCARFVPCAICGPGPPWGLLRVCGCVFSAFPDPGGQGGRVGSFSFPSFFSHEWTHLLCCFAPGTSLQLKAGAPISLFLLPFFSFSH